MEFRNDHPVFRRRKWFMGREIHGAETTDIAWLNPGGDEMTEQQWNDGFAKSIGVFLNGDEIATPGPEGEQITDDSFLLFFNAHHESMDFTVPVGDLGQTVERRNRHQRAPARRGRARVQGGGLNRRRGAFTRSSSAR